MKTIDDSISQQKLKCLLQIALSLLGFGIGLAVIVLDVNVAARIAALVSAFFAGWSCCYSLGVISGGIANSERIGNN